jgi:hypothetical protein
MLHQLVEKRDRVNEGFGAAGGTLGDDNARSIWTRLRSGSNMMKMKRRGGHAG